MKLLASLLVFGASAFAASFDRHIAPVANVTQGMQTSLATYALQVKSSSPPDTGRFSDAERAYVPAAATTRVAQGPRSANVAPSYGIKFSLPGGHVSITNPYLDLTQVFFATLTELHYAPEGALVVGGRVGLDKEVRALGTGYWRIAADGAITPLHTRSTNTYGKTAATKCDARYSRTHLEPDRFWPASNGSIVKAIDFAVVRIEADGYVRRLAGAPFACEENGNASQVRGFVDGPPDIARFDKVSRVLVDPHGNVWVVDQSGCALRRIADNGEVTTVVTPASACGPAIAPENRVGLDEIAWDTVHGNVVSFATLMVAQPVHNLYNTVWRIQPTGETKRVLYSTKVGRSPAKLQLDGISALAVDPQGRIHIASKIMTRGVLAVLRVDETTATVTSVTGAGFATGVLSGEDAPRDGPADRAQFRWLRSLSFAPDGTLYMRDEHLVRKLDLNGQVSTWAF